MLGKLGRKILLRFIIIAIIPTLLTGLIGYSYSAMLLKRHVLQTLYVTAGGIERQLYTLIQGKKARTADFASDGHIREGLRLIANSADKTQDIVKDMNRYLATHKLPLITNALEVFILDKDGRVVSSSNENAVGNDKHSRDYFLQAIELPYGDAFISDIYTAEEENIDKDSYCTSAPLVSLTTEETLGALVIRHDLLEFSDLVGGKATGAVDSQTRLAGLGKTGEVYLVNRDKIMFTSSRAQEYGQFSVLCQLVDTEPVRLALSQGKEMSGVYKNYRGVPVLGASIFIKEKGWIVLAEQEMDEAYRPLGILRNIAIAIAFTALIFIIAMSAVIARRVVKPVEQLKEGVKFVGKGNLTYKLSIETGDEIQDLAEAFNAMTDELKHSYDRVEVCSYEDRKHTRELALKTDELNKANIELKKEKMAMMNLLEDAHEAQRRLQETQAQLLQSEKMAVVGQLAAGVAHEINNPMSFIISNLGTLSKYREDLERAIKNRVAAGADIDFVLEDVKNIIAESLEGSARIKRIVGDLKTFSHIDDAELQLADIHSCIDSALNIVTYELKYRVEIIKEYSAIPKLWCYPMQLSQVFLNLIINASQAIGKQGNICIATKTDGKKVFIDVRDTGCGIPQEIIGRIFEPFFTTKGPGKGTGLGLSIVYNIIKNHKGEIKVASKVGEGTTFTIILPIQGRRENGI